MGGKNSGRQKKPVLPAGSFCRLEGTVVQGGRVEKRRERGGGSASRDGAVQGARGLQAIQQAEGAADIDTADIEAKQKGQEVNNELFFLKEAGTKRQHQLGFKRINTAVPFEFKKAFCNDVRDKLKQKEVYISISLQFS
jgi:hypothetical protein